MTHHHCGCTLLPTPAAAEQLLSDAHVPQAWIPITLEALSITPPLQGGKRSKAYLTTRTKLGPRDEFGHMRYLGRSPVDRKMPRVSHNGERMDMARFARIALGYPDLGPQATYSRKLALCIFDDCFSPDHLTPVVPSPPRPDHGILDVLYAAAWPRPLSPRPRHGWDITTRPGFVYCRAGHELAVYDVARRMTYCAECAVVHRAWERAHNEWLRRVAFAGPNAVESYLLTLWHAHPKDRDDLAALWIALSRAYADPRETRSPADVHAAITGADEPADDEPLLPPEPEADTASLATPQDHAEAEVLPTMAEAVDAMFRDFPN